MAESRREDLAFFEKIDLPVHHLTWAILDNLGSLWTHVSGGLQLTSSSIFSCVYSQATVWKDVFTYFRRSMCYPSLTPLRVSMSSNLKSYLIPPLATGDSVPQSLDIFQSSHTFSGWCYTKSSHVLVLTSQTSNVRALMGIGLATRQSLSSLPPTPFLPHCTWASCVDEVERKKQRQQKNPKRQLGLEELMNEENRCFPDVACGCRRDPQTGWATHWLLCLPPPPQQPSSSPRPSFCLSTAGLWSQDATQEARSCNRFSSCIRAGMCGPSPPVPPSLSKSSTLLMSRVLVLLGPQGQRPHMLREAADFQQIHLQQQVSGHLVAVLIIN